MNGDIPEISLSNWFPAPWGKSGMLVSHVILATMVNRCSQFQRSCVHVSSSRGFYSHVSGPPLSLSLSLQGSL